MTMKKAFFTILICSLGIFGFGQTAVECIKYADENRENQNWPDVIRYCNKGIELNPSVSWFYWSRGTAKQQLKDNRGALIDFDTAIRLKPGDNPIIYYDRAVAKCSLKKYNDALPDFDMSIKLMPTKLAYFSRGKIKILLGKKESACLDLSKAGELGMAEAYELIKKYCN